MLTKINDGWWILRFENEEGKFAWFGHTEGEVKGRFADWMRRISISGYCRA